MLLGAISVISLYRNATESRFNVVGAAGLLVLGAVLVQIGFIVATPALVAPAGRLAGRLPLAPRFALRDAARHRGRSAPAVGAVLAAVAVSSGLLLYVASQDDHDRRHYQAALLPGQGQVSLHVYDEAGNPRSVSVPAVRAALEGALPVRSTSLVRTLSCSSGDDMSSCGWPSFEIPAVNNCPANGAGVSAQRRYADDWRRASLFDTSGSSYATSLRADPVGDARTVQEITGVRSAAAQHVLADGGVRRCLHRAYLSGGPSEGRAQPRRRHDQGVLVAGRLRRGVTDPAASRPCGRPLRCPDPPRRRRRLAAPVVHPAALEERAEGAHEAIGALGVTQQVDVETGYHSTMGRGCLPRGRRGSGDAARDWCGDWAFAGGRSPDHATLAAVGASPRLRRPRGRAVVVAGLPRHIAGVVAGLVPAVALMWARPDFDVVVPWGALTLTLVIVPPLAGVGALLFTRSRLPLEQPRLT